MKSTRRIHYMKGYTVFNVEQIDGLPERYHVKPARALSRCRALRTRRRSHKHRRGYPLRGQGQGQLSQRSFACACR